MTTPTDEEMPEGQEAAPPGTRFMAVLRWVLIVGMTVFAAGVVAHTAGWLGAGSQQGAQLYHCPMHPTYTADRPGECPICGMSLVPVAAKETAPSGPVAARTPVATGHEKHGVPGLVAVQIAPERTQLIGVQTAAVARRALGQSFQLVGYVVPDETRLAHIHTRLSGWLQKLHVDETGQKVKKGDPLFTLFSRELYQAEREFLLTHKQGASTMAPGTLAEVAHAARRRLELLDVPADEIERLEKSGQPQEALLFRSPLSGYVLAKGALEGKFVTPGDELYTVADLSHVWVLAEVYERHISRVETGQKAALSVEALPGTRFEGKVGFLYPTISQRTRTMRVRLEFANPGMSLRPGMYGKVLLQMRAHEMLAVPEEAVVNTGHHRYAFVAKEGGRFEPRLVETGLRGDGFVEVLSGLSAGETVVTSAGFFIDSESRLAAAVAGLGTAEAHSGAGH